MTDAPALDIDGLSHKFGAVKALDDVSLTVPRGAFVALLGLNGAGKTTLFNLVTRLYAARQGRIRVCGADLNAAPRQALSRIGVVFQTTALDRALTVRRNLLYHGALYGIGRRAALARAETLLERLGLADRLNAPVAALSGGQARRVEIARALLHSPDLLLCDEATAGVDVGARAAIIADVHALASDQGTGVLWATHLIDEIHANDPVVVLHKGQVRAHGLAQDLASAAQGDLEAAFLELTRAAPETAS